MSPANPLPQELINEILDGLAASQDVQSLRSCSLVSIGFRDPAQSKLFRTIAFELNNVERRLRIIENLNSILRTHPQLISCIRHVWLHFSSDDPTWVHSNPTFLTIMEQLSNLEVISMAGMGTGSFVDVKKWHSSFWGPIVQPRLKQLHIERIWDFPFGFIVGCSRLESLSLYTMQFRESTSEDPHLTLFPHHPPQLKHLRVQGSRNTYAFTTSWSTENANGLIKFANLLTLDWSFSPDRFENEDDWLGVILSECSQSLLSMKISGQISKEIYIPLGSMTRLEEVIFRIDDLNFWDRSSPFDPMSTISKVLEDVAIGSPLRSLGIELGGIGHNEFLSWFDSRQSWTVLDTAISRWQDCVQAEVYIALRIQRSARQADRTAVRSDAYVEAGSSFIRSLAEKLPLTDDNPFTKLQFYL